MIYCVWASCRRKNVIKCNKTIFSAQCKTVENVETFKLCFSFIPTFFFCAAKNAGVKALRNIRSYQSLVCVKQTNIKEWLVKVPDYCFCKNWKHSKVNLQLKFYQTLEHSSVDVAHAKSKVVQTEIYLWRAACQPLIHSLTRISLVQPLSHRNSVCHYAPIRVEFVCRVKMLITTMNF